MYIAIKWLISLAFAMWLAMCFTSMFLKESKRKDPGTYSSSPLGLSFKNVSEPKDSQSIGKRKYNTEQSLAALHLMMFVAGALAVTVVNKKQEIVLFTRRKLAKIQIRRALKLCAESLKYRAIGLGAALSKYFQTYWKKIQIYLWTFMNYIFRRILRITQSLKQRKLYTLMLNKLKEIREEKEHIGQLLVLSVQENKNIRMQCQLETLAKNRLAQHIENTNKQIKESRSRYVSFQHLYLVTHQENIFLKSRMKKLTREKEEIEKNLMGLINEVYKTKNNELKSYCCSFLVKTKESLLNSDVSDEIDKFMKKSRCSPTASSWHSERSRNVITCTKSWPICSGNHIPYISQTDSVVPLVSEAPKLKGLPGEYVWTVKDKDGIIEKLYEYDYESDFDNGETVRKIRQYSVYYDKDCLLDFTNSITEREVNNSQKPEVRNHIQNLERPVENRRIVSGSEAFKKFLRTNNSIVPLTR